MEFQINLNLNFKTDKIQTNHNLNEVDKFDDSDYLELQSSCSETTTDQNIFQSNSKSLRLKNILQNYKNFKNNEELADIYEFANYFKLRRLSLGLTQTQIGISLNAKEGSVYSQSAICRYVFGIIKFIIIAIIM